MTDIENRTELREIRSCAATIAVVYLAQMIINYALIPVVYLLPAYTEGSLMGQIIDVISYLLIFGVPFMLMAHLYGMDTHQLMGRGKPKFSVYLMTIGLTMGWSWAAGWLTTGLEAMLNLIGLTEIITPYTVPETIPAAAVQFLAIAIIPPIVEELCFRGFYLNLSVRSMGTWGAIGFTAMTFWMAHYSIEIFPLAFGFGMLGGFVRRRYGSLLPSMCGHFVVNATYWSINLTYAVWGEQTGMLLAYGMGILQIFMGAIGLMLFIRLGCLRGIANGTFGYRTGVTAGQVIRASITSLPVWIAVAAVVYFTARGLEVLA